MAELVSEIAAVKRDSLDHSGKKRIDDREEGSIVIGGNCQTCRGIRRLLKTLGKKKIGVTTVVFVTRHNYWCRKYHMIEPEF